MNILIYGDSNSFGSKPSLDTYKKGSVQQIYSSKEMWWYPLVEGNTIVHNSLPGRCVCHDNRWLPYRNASETISTDVYGQFDLAIFMLGTNDLKSEFEFDGRQIMFELKGIIEKVRKMCSNPQIIIISPPRVKEGTPVTDKYYQGAGEKSVELDWYYRNLAIYNKCHYVSGLDAEVGIDGEHLTIKGHKYISDAVVAKVREIQEENENF